MWRQLVVYCYSCSKMILSNKLKFINFPSTRCVTQFFVPKHEAPNTRDIEKLQKFLHDKPRILVVTGKRKFNVVFVLLKVITLYWLFFIFRCRNQHWIRNSRLPIWRCRPLSTLESQARTISRLCEESTDTKTILGEKFSWLAKILQCRAECNASQTSIDGDRDKIEPHHHSERW